MDTRRGVGTNVGMVVVGQIIKETMMNKDETIKLLTDALVDMVYQHCLGAWPVSDENKETHFGSDCISANAAAIEVLCKIGKLELVGGGAGRIIEARVKE